MVCVRPNTPREPRSPHAPGSTSLAVAAPAVAPRPAAAAATPGPRRGLCRLGGRITCPHARGPGPQRRPPYPRRARRRAPETLRTRADPPPRPVGVTWWVWARRRGDGPPLSWQLRTRGACCRAPRFSGASLFLFCSAGPSACRRLLGSLSPELLCRACGNRYSRLWALKFLRFRNLAEDTACPSGILCSSGWCCCPQPHLLSCSKEVTDSKSGLVTQVAYFLYILENS